MSGSVYLQVEGLPEGVTISFAPHPLAGPVSGSAMSIVAAPTAAVGNYVLTVRAASGAYEAAAQVSLAVLPHVSGTLRHAGDAPAVTRRPITP